MRTIGCGICATLLIGCSLFPGLRDALTDVSCRREWLPVEVSKIIIILFRSQTCIAALKVTICVFTCLWGRVRRTASKSLYVLRKRSRAPDDSSKVLVMLAWPYS